MNLCIYRMLFWILKGVCENKKPSKTFFVKTTSERHAFNPVKSKVKAVFDKSSQSVSVCKFDIHVASSESETKAKAKCSKLTH